MARSPTGSRDHPATKRASYRSEEEFKEVAASSITNTNTETFTLTDSPSEGYRYQRGGRGIRRRGGGGGRGGRSRSPAPRTPPGSRPTSPARTTSAPPLASGLPSLNHQQASNPGTIPKSRFKESLCDSVDESQRLNQ